MENLDKKGKILMRPFKSSNFPGIIPPVLLVFMLSVADQSKSSPPPERTAVDVANIHCLNESYAALTRATYENYGKAWTIEAEAVFSGKQIIKIHLSFAPANYAGGSVEKAIFDCKKNKFTTLEFGR